MEFHLHAGDEKGTCRNVGEHSNAGGHIVRLIVQIGIDDDNMPRMKPEYQIVQKQPKCVAKIGYDQFPVPSEIKQG